LFFTSYEGALADAVRAGRRQEFASFAAFADPDRREAIPDPNDQKTFLKSVPDVAEITNEPHASRYRLFSELLAIRAREIAPRIPGSRSLGAQPIGTTGVRARWVMGDGARLTIAINLGKEPVACPVSAGRLLVRMDPRHPSGRLGPYAAEVGLED
jgi:maltooligosyltrehalose trehalohydrolase